MTDTRKALEEAWNAIHGRTIAASLYAHGVLGVETSGKPDS